MQESTAQLVRKAKGTGQDLTNRREMVLQPTAQYLKLQLGTAALAWLSWKMVTQRATNGALHSIQLDVKSENAEHIETTDLVMVTKFK